MRARSIRALSLALVAGMALTVPAATAAEQQSNTDRRPNYIQPGAPGEPSVRINPHDIAIVQPELLSHHEAHYLTHMIPHHGQALILTEMVADRAQDPRVHNLASNIEVVQDSEIMQMQDILHRYGHPVPDPEDQEGHHGMPGMLSPEQLAQLRALEGRAFDTLFLEFMIYHHFGAITMSEELEHHTDRVMNSDVGDIVIHVVEGQFREIMYMESLLREYGTDG